MSGPFDDTIAAIATAPGRGAIALLRVAGPGALHILDRICPGLGGEVPPPRTSRLLVITHPDTAERLDHALVTWFPAPASFTGEDTLEISTHGGLLTPQLVLDALVAAGARNALPGEFTRRALLNGKLDLLQAEAIGDLIDGSSPALHRVAVHQLERGLSARIEMLRRGLLRLEALIAYSIDFPDEDEPPVPPERIDATAADVEAGIAAMLASAPEGELLREGALVVLAGRPNSGKSSLFNALLGRDRAIVTDVPGTTRDALEASLTLDGYPFILVDTAGLRETVDPVERIGIEVARRYLAAAAVVILCVESSRPLHDDERRFVEEIGSRRLLLARTKSDLSRPEAPGVDPDDEAVELSALSGAGLDALRGALLHRSFGGLLSAPAEAPLVTRRRHSRALRRASDELAAFRSALREEVPMELAATHLRTAVDALEEIIGGVSTEDLLDELFGSFCVGK